MEFRMGKIDNDRYTIISRRETSEDIDKSLAKTSKQLKISETIVCQKIINDDKEVTACFWKNFFTVWKGLVP